MENNKLTKVSSDELMKLLSLSKSSIYKLIHSKVLKPFYLPGLRKPYFDLSEVEKVFQRRQL